MAQSVVSLKVFNNDTKEARRLSVDESVCSNYVFINEKIQSIFPGLRGVDYKLTWKDADDDFVRITGDEDLITAFTEMGGNTKVLYVDGERRAEGGSTKGGCPYAEAFDLRNLHAMARQYLEPLLASPQGEQAQALAETIRHAAAGFFGQEAKSESGAAASTRPQEAKAPLTAEQKIEQGLARLQEMGFKNDSGFLRKLLEHLDGDVEGVIKILAK